MRNFHRPGRSAAYAANGMAATSTPLSTLAALDVLRAGGNAVDAAVTASAVLCVSEPGSTGIGGDCFALVGLPDGRVLGLNGSGRAALAADADWLKASGLTRIDRQSVHCVTVPGAIDGWDRLLKAHGTWSLGQCLAPAIDLAEKGVPITPRVAFDWSLEAAVLAADEGGRMHYLKDGRAPRAGETMRYPALAATLRLIAAEGRDAFYEGSIAADMVGHLKARGSLLTHEDFARTAATWVSPISTSFAGHEILEIPPNGQGLTALIALNILAQRGLRRFAPDSAERAHLEIEAMKLAWVFRNRHIADPDFAEVPVAELLSDRTAARLAAMIDMDRALEANLALPPSDTVYLTVVDKNRLAVSFINSVYDGFGSGIVTPKTGIALQNRGSCFVAEPRHPNCIGPGKRPLHTIIPAMVRKDGRIAMSYGVMGGDYQPMGHVSVAVNRLIHGMDPQEAIDWPRYMPKAGTVVVEDGVAPALRTGLAGRGHRLVGTVKPLGGGQAIAIDWQEDLLIGGSDPRKDGLALGY
ncbi:MAG: gamma-glutamyltransferase family protein [Rhizobiales bacterium]|nr:gamma-glutamyltransferase family protein [Hyphomicrobiales bacterium]